MSETILIVDDEDDIRNLVQGILEDEGYSCLSAANSQAAYDVLADNPVDLLVLDIWLQGSEHDGMEILAEVAAKYPEIPVIMISGHGTIETAVSAIKQGAYDFIEKPFKSDRLLVMAQRALEAAALRRENRILKRQSIEAPRLIGESTFSKTLADVIKRVGPTNSRVFLIGEAGTGKDTVARILHGESPRAAAPFMILNCASLRPDRLEVELFGAEEGVSGAPAHTGILESVDGGTLLLDEVADMPLETQGKIVRVLQEQRFQKLGSDQEIKVDVRIMTSSTKDLEVQIAEGAFRQDLYYRLNVVPIEILPLRARRADIAPLAQHFLSELCKDAGIAVVCFDDEAVKSLHAYGWPGNVRQLRNVVEWVLIMHGRGGVDGFGIEHLPPDITGLREGGVAHPFSQKDTCTVDGALMELPLRDARERFERDYLSAQVGRFEGNISKTAEFIGMERSALHRKLKSLQKTDDVLQDKDTPLTVEKRA